MLKRFAHLAPPVVLLAAMLFVSSGMAQVLHLHHDHNGESAVVACAGHGHAVCAPAPSVPTNPNPADSDPTDRNSDDTHDCDLCRLFTQFSADPPRAGDAAVFAAAPTETLVDVDDRRADAATHNPRTSRGPPIG